MRPVPVVVGCMLIAFGLMALLGEALTSTGGFGGAAQGSLVDALIGLPGILLGGGVALLLWGFTEKSARKE